MSDRIMNSREAEMLQDIHEGNHVDSGAYCNAICSFLVNSGYLLTDWSTVTPRGHRYLQHMKARTPDDVG